MIRKTLYPLIYLVATVFIIACKGNGQTVDTTAASPQELKKKEGELIERYLQKAIADSGKTGDTLVQLFTPALLQSFYQPDNYTAYWSQDQQWIPAADSLFRFIRDARLYGLYPKNTIVQN